jgi:hypothetical protein
MIVFTIQALDLEAEPVGIPLRVRCVAQGDLVVAGVTNAITVPLHLQFGEEDRLTVTGEFNVRMSDFSIKRPGGGMHTLIAADRVWISFEWQLVRVHESSAMSPLTNGHNKSCHPTPVDRVVECCCPEPGVGALFRSCSLL